MLTITYQSRDYNQAQVKRAYVRSAMEGGFRFCEVDAKGFDIKQGHIAETMLDQDLIDQAQALKGQAFSYVQVDPALLRIAACHTRLRELHCTNKGGQSREFILKLETDIRAAQAELRAELSQAKGV